MKCGGFVWIVHFSSFQAVADLTQLRKLCWSGIPDDLRPPIWRLLLGCVRRASPPCCLYSVSNISLGFKVPAQLERRQATVARKRSEYQQLFPEYEKLERTDYEMEQLKQIERDVPRPQYGTANLLLFFYLSLLIVKCVCFLPVCKWRCCRT